MNKRLSLPSRFFGGVGGGGGGSLPFERGEPHLDRSEPREPFLWRETVGAGLYGRDGRAGADVHAPGRLELDALRALVVGEVAYEGLLPALHIAHRLPVVVGEGDKVTAVRPF